MRNTTALLAVTGAALLTLTACSSSDDDTAGTPSRTPSPSRTSSVPEPSGTSAEPTTTADEDGSAALTAAVKAYTSAYFKGDAKAAYGALSKRCTGKIDETAYGATVKAATADYGPDHPATDVQTDVSGKLARVTYKVKGLPRFDQEAQPWTLEDNSWKYDAC
ncbi:hypothetical protein RM863_12750 [Streptomyces sp. DSM 41014]|uniref:Lipoprotein n=1 Tax=Streptomyces hintoniae TaxID=3075521 RepID=A0ABU2UIL0_9ACTN|nr:hypothetical protein [Streptomyces sp. DSM 41014]MDT0472993.1 hypothetical protein [Streptomyces sp. DSM 41014]